MNAEHEQEIAWNKYEPQPWHRLPGESGAAFAAFKAFLESDGSLATVCISSGKHRSLLTRWASKYKWRSREAAYCNFLEDVRVRALAQGVGKMNQRHAAVARNMLDILTKALEVAHACELAGRTFPLSIPGLAKAFETFAQIERRALGMSDDSGTPRVSKINVNVRVRERSLVDDFREKRRLPLSLAESTETQQLYERADDTEG